MVFKYIFFYIYKNKSYNHQCNKKKEEEDINSMMDNLYLTETPKATCADTSCLGK